MFKSLAQIFKVKEVRNKIFFVLLILVIYRFVANIPVPAVDTTGLQRFFENNQFLGLLNLFSGGGMENFSIVALGIGPYITSSIVMQLLTLVFPSLERMQKEEGEEGRRKMNNITRILTIPFAAIQGFSMITFFERSGVNILVDADIWVTISTIIILTTGAIFLMWLGELITEKGIGNGISLLIFAGIVAQVPSVVQQTILNYDSSKLTEIIAFLVITVVVVAAIVFITEGQRNIPISYARHQQGRSVKGKNESHLPLRVNQAGVIPIIFAISIMLAPTLISNFFVSSENESVASFAQSVVELFQNDVFYATTYFLVVVGFTFFYTAITFDPEGISENLQRNGGFIPGIRPGKSTADYLKKILNRITVTGALFLALIATLPYILKPFIDSQALTIGGTGILIVVSVVIELVRQIESQMVMRDYESFY